MDRHGGRVALQSRTGGVLTILPGRHLPAVVHRGSAPWRVSVYGGAPVALPVPDDEGKHTVTAPPTGGGRAVGECA